MKRIYLAGGCFWGVEKYVALIPGVLKTEVGYANGLTENPSYEDVRYRESGHAETVCVEYDAEDASISRILELFFLVIDPFSVNRQGGDEGVQYRTGVYYVDEADRAEIDSAMAALTAKKNRSIAVEVMPLENYYAAEEYHQRYLDKNPGGYCHIGSDAFDRLRKATGQTT
jgi:peptide methionine sulfoxide reductase msrA/msrB